MNQTEEKETSGRQLSPENGSGRRLNGARRIYRSQSGEHRIGRLTESGEPSEETGEWKADSAGAAKVRLRGRGEGAPEVRRSLYGANQASPAREAQSTTQGRKKAPDEERKADQAFSMPEARSTMQGRKKAPGEERKEDQASSMPGARGTGDRKEASERTYGAEQAPSAHRTGSRENGAGHRQVRTQNGSDQDAFYIEETGEAKRKRKKETVYEENREEGGWKEKLRQRRRTRILRVAGCFCGVLLVAYTAAAIYFGQHFYEDTQIYGIDCSQKTVDEVKQEVSDKLDQYKLTIQERGGNSETISAEAIDLKFEDNNSIDEMLKAQRSYIWPIMILLDRPGMASVAFSYDRKKAGETLNTLDCFDILHEVAPEDAYIGTTDTGFEVVNEVMGTTLDHEKTLNAVLASLDAGESELSLEDEDCYINPAVYHDNEELVSDAAAMSELARAKITYTFGEEQEVVDASVIRDWIVKLADGSFVIDDVCVTNYVEAMAAKYDTFGLPIEFYTSLGTTETLSGGDYGWCIDQSQTIVELLQALESGYRGTMEPAYVYTAMSHENNGIGYTYVEICISQQRMWCYKDGECIVDTPVVTGNPNKGNATPSGGVWAIDAKKRDAILTGEGYTSPVDYWMPFNEDVGIHDLQTRAYFGGTIYLTNGSHGCVNTPYDQVQIIYDAVSIGTPVIVYE